MKLASPSNPPASGLSQLLDRAGMLVVLLILVLGCALTIENFLTWVNLRGLALAVSMSGMVACTMLFCLAAGDFDLSIGSIVACAGVIAATVMNGPGGVAGGILAALGFGALVGLINGWVVAQLGINALIATLASMQIVRGLAFIVSDGSAVGIRHEAFFALGSGAWLGIPVPVWITLGCFVLAGLVLERTVAGRNILAIGGNAEAARLAGIDVARLRVRIFAVQGMVAALAGVILAARVTSGQPNTSQGFELEVISACVLGGVSLTGGVGRIGFVIAGVLIMGVVQNAMNLLNVATFYQYVARGAILLAAVLYDRRKRQQS